MTQGQGIGGDGSAGHDHVERDLRALAGVSDRGLVHRRNEDAMELGSHARGTLAAVVCDGVSSSRTPELASRAATGAALGPLLDGPATARARMATAVAASAAAVTALGDGRGAPSCTLVAGIVEPGAPGGTQITVGWLGDSRAYWLAAPGAPTPAQVLTTDHSWAVEIVANGTLDAATAAADRRAHAITRGLGPEGDTVPEVATLRPAGPGVLMLCSDGLWNYLPAADALAAAVLPGALSAPFDAAVALTGIALEAGGGDNVTVVVIPVPDPTDVDTDTDTDTLPDIPTAPR
jgi:PPM family protein phosphatase